MIQSEAVKDMPEGSPYHEVQGDVEGEGFEFLSGLFEGKINYSSTDETFKDLVGGGDSLLQSMELEEGELIEGIEANDVGTLLEQFLEYEEKQGSLESSSSVSLLTQKSGTDSVVGEISQNLSSFMDGESLQLHGVTDNKDCQGDSEKRSEKSRSDRKSHFDNHATDHNYACCGFPLRKVPPIAVQINGHSARNGSSATCSPRKSLASDLEHENRKKLCNETEMLNSRKRQSSSDKDSLDKKSRIPKRYRGPYCEDSSDEGSGCDVDEQYNRRQSIHHEEKNDYRRKQRKRKGSYSSDEGTYNKRSRRRQSLHSNNSSGERDYSSSDEDSKNEERCRYDPRQSESNGPHYRTSSGSHLRRKRRVHSKIQSEKYSDSKDKKYHNIELERKMGFKFDQHIKGTGKEERRIVYIGKISSRTTKDDVWRRFRPFGPIEKVTVHFRDDGDNYAFVTFFEYSSAAEAIERGNEDSSLPVLDICFGGRRKFCGGSYVDFDSNTSYLEEGEVSRPPSSDEMDFDTLLRLSQKGLQDRKGSCRGR